MKKNFKPFLVFILGITVVFISNKIPHEYLNLSVMIYLFGAVLIIGGYAFFLFNILIEGTR